MVKSIQRKRSRLCLLLVIGSGYLLLFENVLPKTAAYRKDGTSEINEYFENKRTRTTKGNYLLQSQRGNNVLADNFGLVYPAAASAEYERAPEELPALIVDYANMIRNDIILLDNSVETKTRKRGNIQVEEYSVDPNSPCTCSLLENATIEFDADYYPRALKSVQCSEKLCPSPYKCEKVIYEYTVLRKKLKSSESSSVYIHDDLSHRWIAEVIPVTTSCMCQRDYTIENRFYKHNN